jgi:hypothetical protein
MSGNVKPKMHLPLNAISGVCTYGHINKYYQYYGGSIHRGAPLQTGLNRRVMVSFLRPLDFGPDVMDSFPDVTKAVISNGVIWQEGRPRPSDTMTYLT